MIPPQSAVLLRALVAAEVRFLVFGSQGLRLHHPEALREYTKSDLDILLGAGQLQRAVTLARAGGWQVGSWGQPWEADWSEETLRGRWYVRAVQGKEQVDLTFECPFFSVEAALREAAWIEGVPVCPLAPLWGVKLIKDAAAARAAAAAWGLEIPEAAEQLYRHQTRPPPPPGAQEPTAATSGEKTGAAAWAASDI